MKMTKFSKGVETTPKQLYSYFSVVICRKFTKLGMKVVWGVPNLFSAPFFTNNP